MRVLVWINAGVFMTVQQVRLNYFKASEFNQTHLGGENWWLHMSLDLLYRLDALRGFWGEPITINQVLGAIGRRDDSNSDHNFNKWGEVRGVDVNIDIESNAMIQVFIGQAKQVGFNAIGFYPDSNSKFFHLGVRNQSNVSTWGRVDGEYVTLNEALEYYRKQLRG